MAGEESLTVEILREIRDEVRKTNQRLDAAVERLDRRIEETNQRLDTAVDRLERRIDFLAAEMVKGFTGVHERIDVTNERLERVSGHLHDFHGAFVLRTADLERRMARVEAHLGIHD